jgi:hypothetical protein
MWADCPEKRLLSWREFREHISKLSKEEAILETARLWSQAPISNQYLAADLIRDWPDPWQLIHYNHYDDISITLGMVYTLVLTDDRFDDVEFIVLHDPGGNPLHTAWFEDGKYIVNYEYNEVTSVDKLYDDLKIKYKYSYDDLQISNYK